MKTNELVSKAKERYEEQLQRVESFLKDPKKNAKRKRVFQGFSSSFFRYAFLIGLSFVILFPTIQQILQALRAPQDVNNPAVIWIPEIWSTLNIKLAIGVLDYRDAALNTAFLSVVSMLLQIFATSLAGYSFSRLKTKFSNILFILVILTIVIPPQALSLSQYLYFRNLNLIGTPWAIVLMNLLGMGIRSGIFIFIFRQFFAGLPKELEESAQIDGAGVFRTFFSVMLPNARGAMVTVGLFSFVWAWNDAYYVKIFEVSTEKFPILTMRLINAAENMKAQLFYEGMLDLVGQDVWENPLFLALISNVSALLMMLPLLIMYLFVQRLFVESIERTGIVG